MYLKNFRSWLSHKIRFGRAAESPVLPSALYSSVELTGQQNSPPLFILKIRGSIHSSVDIPRTTVQITAADITDGPDNPLPVHAGSKECQLPDSAKFCFVTELGTLPASVTALENWITVAQINANWLLLPRSGKRTLRFSTSIFGFDNPVELASSDCEFSYENPSLGFIDLLENIKRSKILAVTLAFALSAADGSLSENEIEMIKKWAHQNINPSDSSEKEKKQLARALNKTVALLRSGNTIDVRRVCLELARIATPAFRYDIMEFCLLVAKAGSSISHEKLTLLKNTAGWLAIDKNRFLSLAQKILTPDVCEVQDTEFFLGINSSMSQEEKRLLLNEQYKKWSARVTNFNPGVRRQAAYMLQFIAQTRDQLVK
jgi:uncharacterized tellurite resistance protein B-like protein